MSKTKEQVNRYVTHCRFPEKDWEMVLIFCKRNGLGHAHKAAHPKSDSTFSQFINWYRNGYGSGDVVRYGHTIGILSTYTPDFCQFCVYYSYEGKLIIADLTLFPKKLMKAADGDREKIYSQLRKEGYDFDERLAVIHKHPLPKTNTKIEYTSGDKHGFGVIDRYDGDHAHFVFAVEEGDLRLDFSMLLGDFRFYPISKVGVDTINKVLNERLLKWSSESSQLEKLRPRVAVGRKYWYLTDKFTVSNAIENGTPTNNARYANGNYFTSQSDAVDFLSKIRSLRDDMEEK